MAMGMAEVQFALSLSGSSSSRHLASTELFPKDKNLSVSFKSRRNVVGVVEGGGWRTRRGTEATGSERRRLGLMAVCRASTLLKLVPESTIKKLKYDLPRFDVIKRKPVDLVIVGAGPAGLAVANRVSAEGLSVCCIDPAPQSVWPNNYGVWVDEFEAMDLLDCLDYTWGSAVVYLDDTTSKLLERPYGRVNRTKLKSKMIEACISHRVQFHQSKVLNVQHDEDRSYVACDDGTLIEATAVLDATGFARRLVQYDKPFNPGYQIAYGIVAEVDGHPFDLDKMLFMDWRDSHLRSDKALMEGNSKLPTFLYAMPFSANRIFLEETSLVARPGVPMDVIQRRMEARLNHLGITVRSIEEDEKCVIPMGGVLPVIPQRVLGIGGTAGMVHPSTGYMVARTLAAAPILADSLVKRLGGSSSPYVSGSTSVSSAEASSTTLQGAEGSLKTNAYHQKGDELAAGVWEDLWPLDRQQQRAFFCFGMQVLLKLNLAGTRRFFYAFFDLEPYHWQGFLSSRLYIMELLGFGLALFKHATNTARAEIIAIGTIPLLNLIRELTQMKPPKMSS
ncbi:unnamed protein product [Sphagnum troendelagicum]|uniref:lycopene beta-cyclase n=1 Tax=Sphagnum troendelagicum TaxID=128251 RepID=A0ABP0UWT9_9BRYO